MMGVTEGRGLARRAAKAVKAEYLGGLLLQATQRADLLLAMLVVAVIGLMILPLPPFALDFLISVNIGGSILLLMVSLYIRKAVSLFTFPTLLLLTTLFRLSLGIAATRQILLEAHAGQIIETFGNVVVAGNFVVGGVIFAIITIVQFLVITKGSERVAEVAARFSLDSMPGKQMSIDADLRAGAIDLETARSKREGLERESQFYGAMDGAMKFVKGDAIAGIIIIAVNILGGIAVGMFQMGMSAGDALQTFAVLTIGDGLITQIPALLISVTAGIIVTKVTSEGSLHLGGDIGAQVLSQPKALRIGGGIIAAFCLMPGFPKLPFLLLGGTAMALGYLLEAQAKRGARPSAGTAGERKDASPRNLPAPLALELPERFRKDEESLRQSLEGMLFRLEQETGIPFPPFALRFAGEGQTYALQLYEVPMGKGDLSAGIMGGLDVTPALAARARALLKKHGHVFLGLQETKKMLDAAEAHLDAVVKEAVRSLPMSRIAEVLQKLAREGVPVRNLKAILEALVEWAPKEKDVALLAEYVRLALGRHIVHHYSGGTQVVTACILDGELEGLVRQSVKITPGGAFLSLPPGAGEKLLEALRTESGLANGSGVVLLAPLDIRRHLRGLLESAQSDLPVLSFQELPPDTAVKTVARIRI